MWKPEVGHSKYEEFCVFLILEAWNVRVCYFSVAEIRLWTRFPDPFLHIAFSTSASILVLSLDFSPFTQPLVINGSTAFKDVSFS